MSRKADDWLLEGIFVNFHKFVCFNKEESDPSCYYISHRGLLDYSSSTLFLVLQRKKKKQKNKWGWRYVDILSSSFLSIKFLSSFWNEKDGSHIKEFIFDRRHHYHLPVDLKEISTCRDWNESFSLVSSENIHQLMKMSRRS